MVVWQKVSAWLSAFQTTNWESARVVVQAPSRWSPPSQLWVKLNTDGAVMSHTNMGVWEWYCGIEGVVVVKSDTLKVIAVLNGTCADSSSLCNAVAHRLAKFALSSSNNLVWVEEPPTLIQELLLQDICNSD
ncbi:hypothetical protein ACFXTH_008332 [Malus domestica]